MPLSINTTNGQIYQDGTSSERYKEEIVNISQDVDTSKIYQLRPVSFYYKSADPITRNKEIGLIAEEVAAVYPHLVVYNSNNQPDGVRYQKIPILILAEIQKLKDQIASLQTEVSELRIINNNPIQPISEPVDRLPSEEGAEQP